MSDASGVGVVVVGRGAGPVVGRVVDADLGAPMMLMAPMLSYGSAQIARRRAA